MRLTLAARMGNVSAAANNSRQSLDNKFTALMHLAEFVIRPMFSWRQICKALRQR